MRRPHIALNGEFTQNSVPTLLLKTRYAEAIERAGGLPFPIVPLESADYVERLLDHVDGLVLSGGDDFDTERLGLGPTHPAALPVPTFKLDFDMRLVRAALERELPILGICYGMQLLALQAGGELLQHLPEDRPGGREHRGGVEHAVVLEKGTKLRGLLGVTECTVVSRHHQALSGTGTGWRTSATDDEGLIEAIERKDHPFAVGVQWHPELAPKDGVQARLFEGLVHAAHERRAIRNPV